MFPAMQVGVARLQELLFLYCRLNTAPCGTAPPLPPWGHAIPCTVGQCTRTSCYGIGRAEGHLVRVAVTEAHGAVAGE